MVRNLRLASSVLIEAKEDGELRDPFLGGFRCSAAIKVTGPFDYELVLRDGICMVRSIVGNGAAPQAAWAARIEISPATAMLWSSQASQPAQTSKQIWLKSAADRVLASISLLRTESVRRGSSSLLNQSGS
jgi:hypothetical protein